MIEIAVCDDDPAIAGFLETTLKSSASLLSEPLHIQSFLSGAAMLAALNKDAPFDIIFMDIELGDTTGIAVAEQIRKDFDRTALIFVSAYDSYCKELFQFDTTAFLSKPIDRAEVKSLLLRVYKELRNPRQVFYCQFNGDMYWTPLADILYFESKAHKIEMLTKTGVKIFYGKLDEVELQVKHPGFIRIQHSMLVNLDNVEQFEKNTMFFSGGRTLTLSWYMQKTARNKISDYFSGTPKAG